MNLKELYQKIPSEKHGNIKVVGNIVLYDDGTTIYQAYLDGEGNLVPATQITKIALKRLEA